MFLSKYYINTLTNIPVPLLDSLRALAGKPDLLGLSFILYGCIPAKLNHSSGDLLSYSASLNGSSGIKLFIGLPKSTLNSNNTSSILVERNNLVFLSITTFLGVLPG